MHRRTARILVFFAPLAAACGLGVVGTQGAAPGPGPEAGADASLPPPGQDPDGAPLDGGDLDSPFDAPFPIDAPIDADPISCQAGCDGGTCDTSGFCVVNCPGSPLCGSGPVRCPPNVPCRVNCGSGQCSNGVQCTQNPACNIVAIGTNIAQNAPILCSGTACNVNCNGSSVCDQGILCDAGTCTLTCNGTNACQNPPGGAKIVVGCSSTSCTIDCVGASVCSNGVDCRATDTCNVTCNGSGVCQNNGVHATAPNVGIDCLGAACTTEVGASAVDASINCNGGITSNNDCTQGVFCDAGRCAVSCGNLKNTLEECCKPGACLDTGSCVRSTSGCP